MQDGRQWLNRSRRNLFQALGVVAGATTAASIPRRADAQRLCRIVNDCASGGTTCFLQRMPVATSRGLSRRETLVGRRPDRPASPAIFH